MEEKGHGRGFYAAPAGVIATSGGSVDTTPPVIANMTPSPDVAPGEPGGFPASYALARLTPIGFDVLDSSPGIRLLVVTVEFTMPDGVSNPYPGVLTVYDDAAGGFQELFQGPANEAEEIDDGWHLEVLLDGGWPMGATIRLAVRAVDAHGNLEGAVAVDELVSITVTPDVPIWRPLASAERLQFTAIGHYTIAGDVDITNAVAWGSGSPGVATIAANGQAAAVSAYNGVNGQPATTVITATLGGVVGGTTLSVDTNRDALSGRRIPWNLYQWSLLPFPQPTGLRRCDEASGQLLDWIGTLHMDAGATAPLYQVPVTGWSKTGFGLNGGTQQRFIHLDYADAVTNSMAVLAYVGFSGTPAASSYIMTFGNQEDCSITAGSGGQQVFRYRENANIVQLSGAYAAPEIFPLMLKRNLTLSEVRLTTDKEKAAPTYGPLTNDYLVYGAVNGTASTVNIMYIAEWLGAVAEMSDATQKAMLIALNWSITWT